MLRSRGGGGGGKGVQTTLKNHKAIGFLSNTCPDLPNKDKATRPALNVGPSSAHKQNAILTAFRWRVDDGLLLVVFGSSFP